MQVGSRVDCERPDLHRKAADGSGEWHRPATRGRDVPDAPMQVYSAGLKGCLTWPSFYKAAGFTFEESASTPVRTARWADWIARMAELVGTFRDKQGTTAPVGSEIAPPPSLHPSKWERPLSGAKRKFASEIGCFRLCPVAAVHAGDDHLALCP